MTALTLEWILSAFPVLVKDWKERGNRWALLRDPVGVLIGAFGPLGMMGSDRFCVGVAGGWRGLRPLAGVEDNWGAGSGGIAALNHRLQAGKPTGLR